MSLESDVFLELIPCLTVVSIMFTTSIKMNNNVIVFVKDSHLDSLRFYLIHWGAFGVIISWMPLIVTNATQKRRRRRRRRQQQLHNWHKGRSWHSRVIVKCCSKRLQKHSWQAFMTTSQGIFNGPYQSEENSIGCLL